MTNLKRSAASEPDYEVLAYEATVQLMDTEGREARYTRQERIRVVADGVTEIDSYGWGNGIAFADHEVTPGRLGQQSLVGSRLRSAIKLPRRYHKGEEFTFSVERLIRNGFVSPSEWWLEAELYHAARSISLQVLLPAGRVARGAKLTRPGVRTSKDLAIRRTADGRQRISFEEREPLARERYVITWDW